LESNRMAGKVCIVTGANSGIGKATAKRLAEQGARVAMVCRNKEKGEKAMADIKQGSRSDSVELLLSDFASLASVRALARTFEESHDALHVLVNNAGVAQVRRSVTEDGFETTLQVDYLSHFLLTNLLLDLLKKSSPSRIVNVSSVGHYGGHIDFDDLQMENGYRVMKAYSRAKLAQVLFTYELARKLGGTGVTVNCLHPGAVATNIWGASLGPLSFLGKVSRLFLISPEEGARTSVYLASSPDVVGVTGKYFDDRHEKRSSDESYDQAVARKLWDVSASMVGLA
jgi:NAD(P)-dependent dehydrogenase (short-subunit alcohol dehydrogenase family)